MNSLRERYPGQFWLCVGRDEIGFFDVAVGPLPSARSSDPLQRYLYLKA